MLCFVGDEEIRSYQSLLDNGCELRIGPEIETLL